MKSHALLITALATPILGRTVHSVIVFSRHGDRTSYNSLEGTLTKHLA